MSGGIGTEAADALGETRDLDSADEFVSVVHVEDEDAISRAARLRAIGRSEIQEMLIFGASEQRDAHKEKDVKEESHAQSMIVRPSIR